MSLRQIRLVAVVGMMLCGAVAGASDLRIHLNGNGTVERKTVKYQCDAQGAKMGLPAGVFAVEYLNGAGRCFSVEELLSAQFSHPGSPLDRVLMAPVATGTSQERG